MERLCRGMRWACRKERRKREIHLRGINEIINRYIQFGTSTVNILFSNSFALVLLYSWLFCWIAHIHWRNSSRHLPSFSCCMPASWRDAFASVCWAEIRCVCVEHSVCTLWPLWRNVERKTFLDKWVKWVRIELNWSELIDLGKVRATWSNLKGIA